MFAIFATAFHDYSQADASYSNPVFGIQMIIFIGIGSLLLGVPLMLLAAAKFRPYFRRKTEVAPPGLI